MEAPLYMWIIAFGVLFAELSVVLVLAVSCERHRIPS